MPNWTSNRITLKHKDTDKIKALLVAHAEGKGILQHLIPCPEELNDDDLTSWSHGPEQEAREKKKAAMRKKYGYESWYEWHNAHWGTKWDLCDPEVEVVGENTVLISCQTAWSPPIDAFDTLINRDWYVRALFLGEGCEFAGIYDNGECEDYNHIGDSRAARANLPQELDDAFNIIDTLEEWERENEEDLTRWVKEGAEATKEGE
jgi:hypothetical protein